VEEGKDEGVCVGRSSFS
jgi:hypothetical protein